MIDQHHDCWWRRNRETAVSYCFPRIHGVGVGLRVLLATFDTPDVVWYTKRYGELDENVLLVVPDESVVEHLPRELPERPLLQPVSDDRHPKEYLLTDAALEKTHIVFEEDALVVQDYSTIRFLVHVHDDCFCSVEPVDRTLIEKFVRGIMRFHSYYLKTDVDWSQVIEPIVRVVESGGEIRLKSSPQKESVFLYRVGQERSFIQRFWKRAPYRTILIRDGVARFSET